MKYINKFIQWNKKYFAIILIPILSIFIPAYLTFQQNHFQKEVTPPIFFLEKQEKPGISMIKITNEGGWATYFKFERITEIWVSVKDKASSMRVDYLDQNHLSVRNPNQENKKVWYYIPTTDVSIKQLKERLNRKIQSLSINKYSISLEVKDYYELSYYDSNNEYKEFHYQLDKNGIGQYDESISSISSSKQRVSFGGLSAGIEENNEKFYQELEEITADMILSLRWHVGWWYDE